MLTFTNYRISCRQDGKVVVYADCEQRPSDEAYTLVTCKPSESDAVIIDRASARLAAADVQTRLMVAPQCRPSQAA